MMDKVIPYLGYTSNAVIVSLRSVALLKKIVLTHFLFMTLVIDKFLLSVNEHEDFT
jgi:hypothetical protein